MSTSTAKIERVSIYEVVVPARKELLDSPALGAFMDGTPWPEMPICLIEARTSDGISALGEVGRGVGLAQLRPWLELLPGVELSGISPNCWPEPFRAGTQAHLIERVPVAPWRSTSPLAGAIEMIQLDWAGKRLGCRAVDLLGGACHSTLAVDFWCARQVPDDLARSATRARELGFRGLKTKSRVGDPVVEQVKAIKAAAGDDFGVTIDPMFQWLSPHDALDDFRKLESAGVADNVRIEDPFPQDMPEMWHRVRQVSRIPLIWHGRGIASLRRALQDRCADDYNCVGGIWEFLACAHAVDVLGHACWHGSSIEMGVAQVAHMHAAAAARSCVLPSDFVSGIVREHTLIQWDWPYKDGRLPLPEGHGLGIELDRAAVKKYQTGFAEFLRS